MRYELGPVCSGDPAFAYVLDRGQPYGVVFGHDTPTAESKAKRLVALLNDAGLKLHVAVVEPLPHRQDQMSA